MYFIYCFLEDIVQKGRTFYCVVFWIIVPFIAHAVSNFKNSGP